MSTPAPSDLQEELIRAAVSIAARRRMAHLVYVGDLGPPPALLRPAVKRKLIHAVSSPEQRDALEEGGAKAILVPGYEMGRQEKFKLALVAAAARGYVRAGQSVVGMVGRQPRAYPDTLLVTRIEEHLVGTPFGEIGTMTVAPSVFDAVVELAVELGVEGWEGHALGTMFVVGDSPRIMESSRQLALNPFQGYSESERNLSDPAVRDALRAFATLDGAFVVREDGVVLAAGRYLELPVGREAVSVPLGLGSRHMAAARATAASESIAVVVSQSTGKVRVFRRGKIVLELTPAHRRT